MKQTDVKLKKVDRKKLSLNFIDFILIAVIIIAVGTLIFIFTARDVKSSSAQSTQIEYTLQFDRVNEEFKNLVMVGDKVFDSDKLYAIGEVTDVSYSTAYYKGTDKATGAVKLSEYPGMICMTVTVKVNASVSDGGYSVSEYSIAVGKTMDIRVPNFTGKGVCTSVTAIEEK